MTEEDKLYADELRNRALADYERLDYAINELERQTCETPRNNLAESSQDCISREAVIRLVEQYPDIMGNRCSGLIADIKHLPPVTPSYNSIKTELKPCEDCISREEAIRIAEQGQIQGYEWQFKKLCNLPSVTPKQKVGKWIDIMVGDMQAQACDQCKTFYPLAYTGGGHRFCPNCGAKMEVEE